MIVQATLARERAATVMMKVVMILASEKSTYPQFCSFS